MIRVTQVGDVAGVAALIETALDGHADVRSIPMRQRAASRSGAVKLGAAPFRVVDAFGTARDIRRSHPDVVHVHWVPNAPAAMLAGKPWVLEAHGSDLRDLSVLRRRPYHRMIRAASAFVVATPDLLDTARDIRADARYIPNPVLPRAQGAGDLWDVGSASSAVPVKAPEIGFQTLFLLGLGLRTWASDGPEFQRILGVERVGQTSHEAFVNRLASTRIVLGQFGIGAIGLVELEAMSVGRPVIAYVNHDWYPDPPPIISARDPYTVARHVSRLMDDADEVAELGRLGCEWVARHYSQALVRDALLETYAAIR